MAANNLAKRREVRALEAKRDELMMKRDKAAKELAATKAALQKRRKQS